MKFDLVCKRERSTNFSQIIELLRDIVPNGATAPCKTSVGAHVSQVKTLLEQDLIPLSKGAR